MPGTMDRFFEKSGSSSKLDKSNNDEKSIIIGNIFTDNQQYISSQKEATSSSSSSSRILGQQKKQQLFESQFLKLFENEDLTIKDKNEESKIGANITNGRSFQISKSREKASGNLSHQNDESNETKNHGRLFIESNCFLTDESDSDSSQMMHMIKDSLEYQNHQTLTK